MREISFYVWGTPQPGGSKRAFVRGNYANVVDANPKSYGWKKQVAQIAGMYMQEHELEPLLGPVEVHYTFFRTRPRSHFRKNGEVKPAYVVAWPSTKPDATKLVRSTEDALKGICWIDDAQCCVTHAEKHYGAVAGVKITIKEL